ncbi:MAG: transposase, partial [Chitinophagaceae bacterium]
MPSLVQDHHVQFFTAVCKDWLPLLQSDAAKHIVIDALKYRIDKGEVKVCAYVIMPNHMHLIWRVSEKLRREDFQRDFLKFTAKKVIEYLQSNKSEFLS